MSQNKEPYLGERLVAKKIITRAVLDEAISNQQGTNLRLGQILVKKGIVSEEEVLKVLAEHHRITCKFELEFSDSEKILDKVPVFFIKKNKIVPYHVDNKKKLISIAITDPLNIQPLDDIKILFHGYSFEIVLTKEEEIQRIINKSYDSLKSESAGDVIDDLEDSDFDLLTSSFDETEDILDMANDAPIIKLVNSVIKQAVDDRASDIHIEPFEKDLVIRFRVDGILYKMHNPPKKYQAAITSRVKIMANLNIAENRLPQDGRIQIKIGGKDIDIRVSTFPTHYGERIVLRILNKTDMNFDLNTLGFDKKILTRFEELIKLTHGIILVTGPTGSGKSTTLYSVLTRLNTEDVNILTVEDPIEYQLHGVGQMQVREKIDLTFASGLRSILRQDPDIVMIGEIRDIETAEIAVQSALTGHKVLSTLHTNDAATGVTRLIDMGVEPFLIASSVNAFLAQRLVRKICSKCKTTYKPTVKELGEVGLRTTQLKNGKLYKGKGCAACLQTGYAGRVGLYELLPISRDIRKLILAHSDATQIKDKAVKEGMTTLLKDGLSKVINGETTIEEVLRVTH